VRFVTLTLLVGMQNDWDFVDITLLYCVSLSYLTKLLHLSRSCRVYDNAKKIIKNNELKYGDY
jgi:hypothetical protein